MHDCLDGFKVFVTNSQNLKTFLFHFVLTIVNYSQFSKTLQFHSFYIGFEVISFKCLKLQSLKEKVFSFLLMF